MEDVNMKEETEHGNNSSNMASKNEMLSNLEGPNLTFQIHEEDHTLGNALRHLAMLNPNTTFAGYAIPHPSISTMNLRIETISNLEVDNKNYVLDLKTVPSLSPVKKGSSKMQDGKVGATQVLLKACDDLGLICNKIEDKFDKAVHVHLLSN
ncbi:DNA-directed RNA polymerase subunit [Cryptosporidium sp. chipmunk genotype I]|uniref:DNA-directed RNA polymerase subunit n=1 Tax=Cryptosporidium sp. chipmunk genotype I TaxID=1280935 RepID=UPI00351A122A|nr:DNA-directed RNA polymerase subunit [Cryptosporidium sp. chipmunk genotype I]